MTIYTKRINSLSINFPFNKREVCGDDIVVDVYKERGMEGAVCIYRISLLDENRVKTNTVITEVDGDKTTTCGVAVGEQINSYGSKNRPWCWVQGKEK